MGCLGGAPRVGELRVRVAVVEGMTVAVAIVHMVVLAALARERVLAGGPLALSRETRHDGRGLVRDRVRDRVKVRVRVRVGVMVSVIVRVRIRDA